MQLIIRLYIISESIRLLQLNIEAKNIKIDNNLQEGSRVKSDPYFLQTILRNLLQNAIKSSPQNGNIKINYTKADGLTIENEGGHFSQQQYETLLTSKEDKSSLSGLGLRLVDELSRKINASVHFTETTDDTTMALLQFENVIPVFGGKHSDILHCLCPVRPPPPSGATTPCCPAPATFLCYTTKKQEP